MGQQIAKQRGGGKQGAISPHELQAAEKAQHCQAEGQAAVVTAQGQGYAAEKPCGNALQAAGNMSRRQSTQHRSHLPQVDAEQLEIPKPGNQQQGKEEQGAFFVGAVDAFIQPAQAPSQKQRGKHAHRHGGAAKKGGDRVGLKYAPDGPGKHGGSRQGHGLHAGPGPGGAEQQPEQPQGDVLPQIRLQAPNQPERQGKGYAQQRKEAAFFRRIGQQQRRRKGGRHVKPAHIRREKKAQAAKKRPCGGGKGGVSPLEKAGQAFFGGPASGRCQGFWLRGHHENHLPGGKFWQREV